MAGADLPFEGIGSSAESPVGRVADEEPPGTDGLPLGATSKDFKGAVAKEHLKGAGAQKGAGGVVKKAGCKEPKESKKKVANHKTGAKAGAAKFEKKVPSAKAGIVGGGPSPPDFSDQDHHGGPPLDPTGPSLLQPTNGKNLFGLVGGASGDASTSLFKGLGGDHAGMKQGLFPDADVIIPRSDYDDGSIDWTGMRHLTDQRWVTVGGCSAASSSSASASSGTAASSAAPLGGERTKKLKEVIQNISPKVPKAHGGPEEALLRDFVGNFYSPANHQVALCCGPPC